MFSYHLVMLCSGEHVQYSSHYHGSFLTAVRISHYQLVVL